MRVKKVIYIILGCLSLGLGSIGTVVPLLPTVPFFMLATFAFAKSSERLHNWFTNTEIYKKNLETYIEGKGMTWAAKVRIMSTITLLMMFGFVIMMSKDLYIPCLILCGVWIIHIIYFVFGIKIFREELE